MPSSEGLRADSTDSARSARPMAWAMFLQVLPHRLGVVQVTGLDDDHRVAVSSSIPRINWSRRAVFGSPCRPRLMPSR